MEKIIKFYLENNLQSHYSLTVQAVKKFHVSYFIADIAWSLYITQLINSD